MIIKRIDGSVIAERKGNMKQVIQQLVAEKINLSGANLYGVDMSWANLYGVDMSEANIDK